jgi:translation initiation factor IF-3
MVTSCDQTAQSTNKEFDISDPRINDRIRVPEVRMVGPNGEQVGIVRIEDALRLAQESDLDLVEVAPNAKPPVCKLMDFGKYKYEAAVKARESRKNQTNTVLKEVRFRLKIDSHDYETKKKNALKFLSQGDKVKAMIQFRGREQQRPEFGIRLLQKFAEDVAEVGSVESAPRQDGRNMVMVVGPLRTKADAKAEARRTAKANGSDKANRRRERQQRVDTSAPQVNVANSVGDAMPDALKAMAKEPEAAASAPKAAATTEAPAAKPDTKPAAKSAPAKPAAKPAAAKPTAAKPAATKPAAAKPAATKASSTAAKPASSGTAKPAAKPQAPKPGASAPKPTPRPAPKPSPKPGPRSGK